MPLQSIGLAPPGPRNGSTAQGALLRRIDLTTLRLFIAVCEEKNLTRAASREGIAASAVSKRMADFELAFGVTLFEPPSNCPSTRKASAAMSACSPTCRRSCSSCPRTCPAFSAHEFLKVDLQERPSGQVVRGLEEGAAEIGVCSGEAETRSLETFHYRYDNLVLVVRPDHPLAARDGVRFADTLDFDHIGLHAASSIYLMSQYAATQAGKSMRLRIHVPGFDAVCRMVQANMGIGVIPDRAFDVVGAGMGLRSIGLCDEWARRELKIVVRDVGQLSTISRLMLDHLRAAERCENGPGLGALRG